MFETHPEMRGYKPTWFGEMLRVPTIIVLGGLAVMATLGIFVAW